MTSRTTSGVSRERRTDEYEGNCREWGEEVERDISLWTLRKYRVKKLPAILLTVELLNFYDMVKQTFHRNVAVQKI